ncbi:MAG TPA: asparagine synthase-related protein [Acidimicrobiia bacterium]|nr:asparagine synthase-related protein [Acidimicrobiia bacterium]
MGVPEGRAGRGISMADSRSAMFTYSRAPGRDAGRASFRLPPEAWQWRDGSLSMAVVGDVYDGVEAIPDLYRREGIEALTRLHGSFLLFVADEARGQAWVVNDHIGSRAAYIWENADTTLVTNSLADGPRSDSDLDPTGVCSYLANDGVRAGLTPWASARTLPAASVLGLHTSDAPAQYWRQPAMDGEGTIEDLAPQMLELMRAAVERRRTGSENLPVVLSLSGGVDSKGLLGLLLEQLPADRISAYTYYNGEQVGDMDLPEARRAALAAGISHHPIPGYRNDFLHTLVDNALRGEGVAHFCDDADVWRHLGGTLSGLVVAGDRQAHQMGHLPEDLPISSLLSLVSLFPTKVIDWFLAMLPSDGARAMVEGWEAVYGSLLAEYGSMDSWRIACHPAYIEQRANPTLTLWRERFSSQAGRVISPFLDRDLLDFVGRLPIALNDVEGNFLHRIALERAFPNLFAGENAHGGWNIPDWGEEMRSAAKPIRSLIEGVGSPLEALVPKEVTLRLLESVSSRESPVDVATTGWKWQLRKLVKSSELLTRLARERKLQQRLRGTMKVGEATMLRRLLTLHLALADHSSVIERFEEVRNHD